jgi:hypothetical protein
MGDGHRKINNFSMIHHKRGSWGFLRLPFSFLGYEKGRTEYRGQRSEGKGQEGTEDEKVRRWDRAEDKNGGWLDWRVNRRYSLSLYPLLNEPVDFFSVNYTKDENSVIGSFENHPVISNSQLPESFKGSL